MMMLPICIFFLYPTHLSSFYPTISFYRCFTAKMGLGGSWSPPRLCSPETAAGWGISDGHWQLSALSEILLDFVLQ